MPLIRVGRTESAGSYTNDVGAMTKGLSTSIIAHMIQLHLRQLFVCRLNDALPREHFPRVVVSMMPNLLVQLKYIYQFIRATYPRDREVIAPPKHARQPILTSIKGFYPGQCVPFQSAMRLAGIMFALWCYVVVVASILCIIFASNNFINDDTRMHLNEARQ